MEEACAVRLAGDRRVYHPVGRLAGESIGYYLPQLTEPCVYGGLHRDPPQPSVCRDLDLLLGPPHRGKSRHNSGRDIVTPR